MTALSRNGRAARWFAGWGVKVVPVNPGGWFPTIPDWPDKATTDLTRLGRWWSTHPDDNLAAVLDDDWLVVDAESPFKHGEHNPDEDGVGELYRIFSLCRFDVTPGGDLDTLVVSTKTGGEHWWFRLGPHLVGELTAGRVAPGIDVKTGRSCVMLPPSVTPVGEYEVDRQRTVDGELAEPLPVSLIPHLRKPTRPRSAPRGGFAPGWASDDRRLSSWAEKAAEGAVQEMTAIHVGERNDRLVGIAYRLGRLSHALPNPNDALGRLSEAAYGTGLSDPEVTRTIDSGWRAGVDAGPAYPAGWFA